MSGDKNATASGKTLQPPDTRVAIPGGDGGYDIVDVSEACFERFSARVLSLLSGFLDNRGASIPEVALREVVDNLVHAVPCSASIVLDRPGSNIYVCDTGPGISRPDLALRPGYSTATALHRSYIRGVGMGFSFAREDALSLGGDLQVETIPGSGTYVHISLSEPGSAPGPGGQGSGFSLSQRQNNILFLLSEGEPLGPSRVASELNIGVSTAHRDLVKLQELELICVSPNGKRFLSDIGRSYLQSLLLL